MEDLPLAVPLDVAVLVERRPLDVELEVGEDHRVLERPGAGGLVVADQVDLGVVAPVAAQERGRPHGLAAERHDVVPARELVEPAAVAGGGLGHEAGLELVPQLLVDAAEVAVLQPLDQLDLDEVLGGHGVLLGRWVVVRVRWAGRWRGGACRRQRMVPTPGMRGRSSAVTQPGGQLVDVGHGVEGPQPGGQAAGGGRVAPAAVGEAEGRLLGDGRGPVDHHPVDVVLVAPGPVGRGVLADPVDVLEADPGLAADDPVDGEPDGGHVARAR